MKIAVTGGSGFVGNHLVEKLVSEGHEIKVFVRKTSNNKLLEKLDVELVCGDLLDKKSIESLVKDVDVVYHLAAKVYAGSRDEFWNVNLKGTENMLGACLNTALNRFVHVSTVGVTGSIETPPGDESNPYNATSPYDQSKRESEKIALQYHREHEMPVTIVRAPMLYGPRYMGLEKFYEAIQSGSYRLIGSMTNFMHPCYIENFLQGLTLAGEQRKAIGEVYIIADEKPITWVEYVSMTAEALGVNPPNKHVSKSMMKFIASLSEFKSWMFGGEPIVRRGWIDELTKNFAYDITKARKDLGYSPEFSTKEGVTRTIDWYRKNSLLK